MKNLEIDRISFIEHYFRLGAPSSTGWCTNLTGCPYCHDGKSKNPRSHFIFSSDEIGWQCFNCGGKHRFNSNNIHSLASFISKSCWKKIGAVILEIKQLKIFHSVSIKAQEDILETVDDSLLGLIDYKEVELPGMCIPYTKHSKDVSKFYRNKFKENKDKTKEYLIERGLYTPQIYSELSICMDGEFKNRLIFPIKFDGILVSWAARSLFPTKNKYLYPPSEEENNKRGRIIYGLDKLFKWDDGKQLFLCESINDAIHLNGMAVLSKNITDDQISILKQFNFRQKKLVFVLDNDTISKWDSDLKGGELGKRVFKECMENWKVSMPNFGTGIKDVSDSIKRNGVLETYDKIMSSIVTNSKSLEMKMKVKSTNRKSSV